jgi:hypothetical protein
MALKPQESLATGAALAFGIIALYDHFMPSVADHKAAPANLDVLDKSRLHATGVAVAIVAGVSLLAKDPTIFVIGGTTIVALDFSHRYANASDQGQPIAPANNPTSNQNTGS